MYTEFFGLNEKPFSISPDPRYLYMSQRHADALAHLIYGISESGGFIQLTGEVGTGKTTLIRSLLEQLPEKTEIALILNPQLSSKEFLQSICQELDVPAPTEDSVKAYIDNLNARLLEANAEDRRVVLIVDEAQTLAAELLEQVRLLTNLETAKRKLLQIILIGQPELRDVLARPDMRQVAQRITGRFHLQPLSTDDARLYVRHRLRVAGAQTDVFTKRAMRRLYKLSSGIPRLINVIADRALLAAYTQEQRVIGARLVERAADEVFGRSRGPRWLPWAATMTTLALLVLVATRLQDPRRSDVDFTDGQPEDALSLVAEAADAAADAPTGTVAATGASAAEATPEEAPPTAGAPTTSLGSLLASGDWPTDAVSAASALFGLWDAEYSAALGEPCDQAEAQGLKCLALAGSAIGDLRRLNRPVVLTLSDSAGAEHHVVMSGLGYDHAELFAGGRSTRIDVADLTHYWYGDHWLLWQPATDVSGDLIPGMRSSRVPWLRESLALIRGTSAGSDDPTLYDAELVEWVRDYQRHRQLEVDGVVGSRTQIALQSDLGLPDSPMLSKDL